MEKWLEKLRRYTTTKGHQEKEKKEKKEIITILAPVRADKKYIRVIHFKRQIKKVKKEKEKNNKC